ncbi:MAG: delta(1)-pyrroline-2-carboxylate reductase family protein [Betaproteobacteria bacterium]
MLTAEMFSPEESSAALPYAALAREIAAVLLDDSLQVPPRLVQPLAGGGSLFVMPAADSRVAMTKLITFVASNCARGLPAIQGDVLVFDVQSGRRLALLDGPTVTARRTAAVTLLAAQQLAARPEGPLLIVGAGVQGRAHLEALSDGLGITEVVVASRSEASALALVQLARQRGLKARLSQDANAELAHCPLVVSCTPAQQVVLHAMPRADAFVAAVGAFTPRMVEWAPEVCRQLQQAGTLLVDTRDADHEAGDLLQAGIDVSALPTLADLLRGRIARPTAGPVFFKSCGWAGWDLAAARCVAAKLSVTA